MKLKLFLILIFMTQFVYAVDRLGNTAFSSKTPIDSLRIITNGDTTIIYGDSLGIDDGKMVYSPTLQELSVSAANVQREDLQTTNSIGLQLKNITVSTVGVPVQISPDLRLYDQVWDTDGSNDTYEWRSYTKGTSGATTSSTMYWDVSKNGAAYSNKMTLTSGGVLTCDNYGSFNGAIINGTNLLYYSSSANGRLVYSANNWQFENTHVHIGETTPEDQDTYGFYINYDADSDASATTASQFAITPVGNATPASSTIAFTQSVGAGYTFDKPITAPLAGSLSTITASADDVDVTNVSILNCDSNGGNITIGGFVGGEAGQILHLYNSDSNNIILEDDEGTGNQDIKTISGADITITAEGGSTLVYDGTDSIWRMISIGQ